MTQGELLVADVSAPSEGRGIWYMGSEPKMEQMWHQPRRTDAPVPQIFHLLNLLQKELIWRKVLCAFPPWNSQTGFTREFFPKQWVFTFIKWSERSVLLQHAKKYWLCLHHFIKCECQILYSFKLATRSCNSSVCLFKKKSRAFSLCLFKLHLIRAPICPSLIAFQILKKNDNSFCQL